MPEWRMADNTPKDPDDVRVWPELKRAGIIGLSIAAAAIVVIYGVAVLRLMGRPTSAAELGQFGDAFGALTSLFNALAFSAVVVTVVLQSKELRESRKELKDQATAQKAWADAAVRQIEVTERLERLKIRPFLISVWNRGARGVGTKKRLHYTLMLRNVGLGPGVVDRVDLYSSGILRSGFKGTDQHGVANMWLNALIDAGLRMDTNIESIRVGHLRDRNRALAPGAEIDLVRLEFATTESDRLKQAMRVLPDNFEPLVHFHSLDGEVLTTRKQLEVHQPDLRSPPRDNSASTT